MREVVKHCIGEHAEWVTVNKYLAHGRGVKRVVALHLRDEPAFCRIGIGLQGLGGLGQSFNIGLENRDVKVFDITAPRVRNPGPNDILEYRLTPGEYQVDRYKYRMRCVDRILTPNALLIYLYAGTNEPHNTELQLEFA